MIPFIICVQIVTNSVEKFSLRRAFLVFLYFDFVHDSIRYLCAKCVKCSKKFRLRWTFIVLVFQFRSRFRSLFVCKLWQILLKNYACGGLHCSCISISFKISLICCVRLRQMFKKISPTTGFCRSCILISFTIQFIICVQTVTNSVKKNSPAEVFRYCYISISTICRPPRNLFLPTPLLETVLYAYMNPSGDVETFFYTPGGSKKLPRYARIFLLHSPTY